MRGGFVQDGDHRQVVPLADVVIVRIMGRGDLERTGAKLAVHVFIGDHRDLAAQHRHQHLLADELLVALILRMDCHGGIAQDGFRAGGGHRDDIRRSHPPACT